MSSEDVYIPQWSVLDGYLGHRPPPPLQSISPQEAFSLLHKQALLPLSQKSLSQLWCAQEQPPRIDLHHILLADDAPTSARVLALDVLACHPHPEDLPILWEIFMLSRFGITAEDPDLFTRSLHTIITIEDHYPKSNQTIFSSVLPTLFQQAVRKRDQLDIPIQVWTPLLEEYYRQYEKKGIRSFLSEEGSLFQELVTQSQQDKPMVPTLPERAPGQYQELPTPNMHQADIMQYTAVWTPSIVLIGLCGVLLSLLSFRRAYKRMAALLFGLSLICFTEGVFAELHQPTYAEQPLFSFIDFSYQPYEVVERNQEQWWISQGGPARWQEIPDREDIFRIAVLGASSAHASNLLQHESFSALLEKQLQAEYPNTPIQVVNMAIGGTISNGILSSGKQALHMGSDAIIIYYGHNEVAQFQQLTHFSDTKTIALRIFFSKSRLYAWLNNILPKISVSQDPTQKIDTPDPKKIVEWASQNHKQNIELLLQDCHQKNIPVLQISPTYNFRFAPFEAQHKEINPLAIHALQEARSIRPTDSISTKKHLKEAIQQSREGSDVSIMAQRILAEILSEQGHHKQARTSYQQVFDQASGVTTVHSNIKKNIQELAQQYGTGLLDAQEVFYHNSVDGITANGLFWDELHPNARGHRYLADAIIPWAKEKTSSFLDSSPNP